MYEEQLSQSEIEELRGQIDEWKLDAGLDYRAQTSYCRVVETKSSQKQD